MKDLRYKTMNGGILDVDSTSRRLKIAIASFSEVDSDNDLILESAVTKTIAERGPNGTNEIWHLMDHYWSLSHALCKFSELYVEGKKLIGISSPSKTTKGNDIMELYADGHINQHSIGFHSVSEQEQSGYNLIKELKLYEGSSVLWGANPNTPAISVSKSLFTRPQLDDMLTRTIKSLSHGKYSDETFYILQRQFEQVQQYIKGLDTEATPPSNCITGPVVPAPDYSGLLADIKSITKTIQTNQQ